jgi:gliding motility-associated-like protein
MKKVILLILIALSSLPVLVHAQSGGPSGHCPLHVPNAFTPNGDNLNETFQIRIGESCEVISFDLKIFDRWGRLIHQADEYLPSQAWDGTADGQPAKQGVYMYQLEVNLRHTKQASGQSELSTKKGSIVLIR